MELVIIYSFFIAGLGFSIYKDRQKTKKAFLVAGRMLLKMLPGLLLIVAFVGLLLGFVPPKVIGHYLGRDAGFAGTLLAAVIGGITLIPALVSFPLAGSLLRSGAAVMTVAAFITTLTMVGTVTASLEIRELGKRFTLLRNILSFLFALLIGIIMGVILP
jgi:uncharacterized membrane protein YraQ (UPF0718 family)